MCWKVNLTSQTNASKMTTYLNLCLCCTASPKNQTSDATQIWIIFFQVSRFGFYYIAQVLMISCPPPCMVDRQGGGQDIINCRKIDVRLEVWFRGTAWLTPSLSSVLQNMSSCLCCWVCPQIAATSRIHIACLWGWRWRWNTTPWLQEYHPQGKQASLLCSFFLWFSCLQ